MSTCSLREVFDASGALLSPLVAIVVAYVAFQQWKTNLEREKRESRGAKLAVYRRVKLLLRDTLYTQTLNPNLYSDFCDACAEADFLFPEKLRGWLNHLQDVAAHCKVLQEDVGSPVANEKSISKLENEIDGLMNQLRSANDALRDMFAAYLAE